MPFDPLNLDYLNVDLPPITIEGLRAPLLPVPNSPFLDESTGSFLADSIYQRGALKPTTNELKFPQKLTEAHISDWMSFYFLDLVTKEGDKEVFASEKAGAGKYARAVNTATSKISNKSPVNSATSPLITSVTKAAGEAVNSLGGLVSGAGEVFGADKFASATESLAAGIGEEITGLGVPTTYAETGDIIHLLMPESLEFNDGAGWQAVNSTPTGLGLLADIALTDTKFGDVARFELAKKATSLLMNDAGAAVESIKKKTLNPYTSQAFESMARRQFRFSWVMTPKNGSELVVIKDIIKMFRYHMHPLLEEGQAYLKYPSQVDIEFKSDFYENKWLPKIARCVIKDFSVNFTPNNQWVTVDANDPGAPYQYQLSVTLEEIVPLTKKDIQEGF